MSEPVPPPPLPVQPIVLGYGNPDLIPDRPLIPLPEKFFHFFTTIVLPLVCFGITASGRYAPGPEWQRDEWYVYLGLIPNLAVGWAFYPLLLISMYAAGWMIFGTRRAIESVVALVGVFTGVVLAWQYSFIHVVCLGDLDHLLTGTLLGFFIPIGFVGVLLFGRWAADALIWSRRWYLEGRGKLYFWTAVALAGITTGVLFPRQTLGGVFFGSLVLAPGLTMFSFVAMTIVILRKGEGPESSRPLLVGLTAWLTAYGLAWIQSYTNAIEAYAKLPPTHPGCYIATAAMHGHRRFVGRREINGRAVSPQLAVLKAGELAIRSRYPRVHRAMRAVYDVFGPRLASGIRNPVIADLVYVSLKPIEWMTVLCISHKGDIQNIR